MRRTALALMPLSWAIMAAVQWVASTGGSANVNLTTCSAISGPSGVIRDADLPTTSRVASVGRPSWWAMAVSLAVAALVTADLLTLGWLERMDLRVAETVGGWGLQGLDGFVVEDDGAGAADAVLAADMGAGLPAIVANDVDQRPSRFHLHRVSLAVDIEGDFDFLHWPQLRSC